MKKRLATLALSSALLFGITSPHPTSAKVMWNGSELKKGQIGLLTVVKQTNLLKETDGKITIVRALKPGEVYRNYSFAPGRLGVGAGLFINRDDKITYQTPSKEKLQALGVQINKHKYQGILDYPQVANLISKEAQGKINAALQKHVRNSYKGYVELEKQEQEDRQAYLEQHGKPVPPEENHWYSYEYHVSYEVKYNENNQLSILMYDYMYTGGAHGITGVKSYNFNAVTGEQIHLEQAAGNKAALSKISKYALNELNKSEYTFKPTTLNLSNNTAFYFTPGGITLKFQQYEVAAYAAGMPEVAVPYKIFK
ncbi:DUF3298/DUF4163 domain-containing protein [Neobacillus piezotolerans]|uniref:DUF3298/DUF4163 domain-containing protein n=1 Tax=Neobacillus piezotolerans TaxID=2259171 RepID=A0A3D8GRX2_9BACI|nr:DUF3298 and DUF4163 domain-containing protein [Neobacillus piezotolerans]RDU37042.1 DUF3298/DUF4163 domain-containing protein [Neobacillus piezotolerans]